METTPYWPNQSRISERALTPSTASACGLRSNEKNAFYLIGVKGDSAGKLKGIKKLLLWYPDNDLE